MLTRGKITGRIKEEIDQAYFEVMTKGDLVNRGQLKSFEKNLAKFVGTKFAVGLNSGYDALHISLRAAGIGSGDEVIVPAHTFVATCSAVVNVGATPVLVDVGKDFNIDVDRIEDAISSRTRGILPVHLNGYMADMPRIMEIAAKYRLAVIEDACQSLGSSIDGKGAGSWGLTGCWSFYPFKMLGGYGDGGAITTDDPEVALFATRMRYNGEDRETGEYHGHGFTCLLDNLQAAFLDVKLGHLPSWIERRKEIARRYRAGLRDVPGLMLPHYDRPGFDHVYQNYVVRSDRGDSFSDFPERKRDRSPHPVSQAVLQARSVEIGGSGFSGNRSAEPGSLLPSDERGDFGRGYRLRDSYGPQVLRNALRMTDHRTSVPDTVDLALRIRRHAVRMTHYGKSSHIGAVLSIADILAVLYGRILKVKPDDPDWQDRDRFHLEQGTCWAREFTPSLRRADFSRSGNCGIITRTAAGSPAMCPTRGSRGWRSPPGRWGTACRSASGWPMRQHWMIAVTGFSSS